MIMLALAPPSIAVVSFDHRCATPIPHVATGPPSSSLHRSPSKQAFNAPRQQTASVEIPIASDPRPRHTFRGFLLWRFAYAGPGVRRATIMGPASANLHISGRSSYQLASSNTPQLRPIRSNLGVSTGAATVCTKTGRNASDGHSIRLRFGFCSSTIFSEPRRSLFRIKLSQWLSRLLSRYALSKRIRNQ
jgi:hypothetical protein